MQPRRHNLTLELQSRDLSILRGLFESRIMGLDHIAAMYFAGHREAAQKRVQKLKAAGYVAERPRRPYERALAHLTRRAFEALQDAGQLSGYPPYGWARLRKRIDVSPYTIAHETAVLDVKTAFVRACAAAVELSVVGFTTWPTMLQFEASPHPGSPEVLVKPDGYFELDETVADDSRKTHRFYLEVDRSTEPLGTLILRAACYRSHGRRLHMATRSNESPSPTGSPFRVLFVCKTPQRRDNLADRLLLVRPPILTQVWLTTQEEVTHDPLGPIWLRPIDFRESAKRSKGSPVDTGESNRSGRIGPSRPSPPQKVPLIDLASEFERNLRLF